MDDLSRLPSFETNRGIAHPWFCDAMGHMNSRFHAALFDDASMHFLQMMGQSITGKAGDGIGWADVRDVTEFYREVPSGTPIVIRSRLMKLGRTSMTIRHELFALPDEVRCASMEATVVCFDLRARASRALPDSIHAWAASFDQISQ